MPTSNSRIVSGLPQALERALARDLKAAQADDPLAPVAVLIAGTLMRPYLQRRMADLNGGIANVHFLTPAELALALGERAVVAEGREPLPPLADRVLLRQIVASHTGYFEPVRDTPGFGDALHRLVRELRGAGYDGGQFAAAVEHACETDGKADGLSAIFTELLERRAPFYGPDDCLLGADAQAPPWTWLGVYGLWEASAALRRALEELAVHLPLAFYLPWTDTDADRAHAEFRDWIHRLAPEPEQLSSQDQSGTTRHHGLTNLFSTEKARAPQLDGSLRLLSGPDPSREVREVARACLGWAREGMRFHEMAVVYRHQEQYRPIIESVFAEARIPLYLHEGTPLAERPVGRRAMALLDLIDGDLDRRAVMDFVTDTRLPKATREAYGGAPGARWDRLSRDAGIVRGLDQWQERLARHAEELRGQRKDYKTRDADHAENLRRFVTDLHAALGDHQVEASWGVHLKTLRRLLSRFIQEADPVLDPLEGLGRLDAVSGNVSFARFREIVRGAIENLRSEQVLGGTAPGAFARRGVNVLDVNTLRHLSFRAVAIVGLSERSFPSPPRPDPLLLDHERELLNKRGPAPIPFRVRGPDPEPLQFAVAVASARERLLVSYPRKGSSDGRPQLPSSFFRALAEAVQGEPVSAEKVDSLPESLYERVSGSRIGASSFQDALSEWEHDRTLIEQQPEVGRAALTAAEPRIARGFAVREARLQRELTPFDGVLSAEVIDHLQELRPPESSFSPSALETFAACPHRYFLGNVLRLKPVEEPEETSRISALDRGSLIHRILQRFLGEVPEGEALLHGPGEQARLTEILQEECDRVEARGETGYALMWGYDRGELREDLSRWLEVERQDPSFTEMPYGDFEVGFGRRFPSDDEGALSREDPIEITAQGATLRIGGRIDRLNWNESKTKFRVIDYKTGRAPNENVAGALKGGRALQLPIYLYAGAELGGMLPTAGTAEYHYASRRGRFQHVGFTGEDLGTRAADFERLLAEIAQAVNTGVFQRAPYESRYCDWCDFDKVCPTGRFADIRRKAEDPHATALADLREIE